MAIINNVSNAAITLTSKDGDSVMVPVGKNLKVQDKFLVNVLPGIVVVEGPAKKAVKPAPKVEPKKEEKKPSKKNDEE